MKKSLTDADNKLVIFYTALYHCMLAPNIYEDVDGKYRGRDNKIHTADDFNYYTVFSLWDTYRALHPLLTIIDQKEQMILSILFKTIRTRWKVTCLGIK